MSEVLDMILKDYAFLEMILSISLSCYKMKTSFHVCHLNQVYTFIVCCACRSVLRDRVVLFLYGKWVVIATFINKIVEYQVMEKTCSLIFFYYFFVNTVMSVKQTKVLLMHEKRPCIHVLEMKKNIIFINVLSLVLWNQTMSADAFDGESGSWPQNWSLLPPFSYTHIVYSLYMYHEDCYTTRNINLG